MGLGEIKQVYGDQYSLFIEDSFGVKTLVLDKGFLSRINNPEDKQVCENSFGEILDPSGQFSFIFEVKSQCKKTTTLVGGLSKIVRKYESDLRKSKVRLLH